MTAPLDMYRKLCPAKLNLIGYIPKTCQNIILELILFIMCQNNIYMAGHYFLKCHFCAHLPCSVRTLLSRLIVTRKTC